MASPSVTLPPHAKRFTDEYGNHPSDVVMSGSKKNTRKWEKVAVLLEDADLTATRPHHTEHLPWSESSDEDTAHEKACFVNEHLAYLAAGRSLLVCNYPKDGQQDHIGAHALLQMTAAYIWNKPIFILNGMPSTPNRDEILALYPKVLDGDLNYLIHYLKEGVN